MNFTIEENKKRQVVGDVNYIDDKPIKLHLHIYKMGKLKDIKELSFSNDERCVMHIENLIKTTEYNLHSFSTRENFDGNLTYYIALRK